MASFEQLSSNIGGLKGRNSSTAMLMTAQKQSNLVKKLDSVKPNLQTQAISRKRLLNNSRAFSAVY